MTTSNAVVTTTNMELSPVRVTFNNVDLGGTLSNAVISMKYMKANILADQSGKSVRDRRVSGTEITITTEITEIQNKDNWKIVFPSAHEITTSTKAMYFIENIGDSDLGNAHALVLHPLSKADADLTGDFKFYKAVASEESTITYGPENQATLKIVWNVLPDESVVPNRYMIYGDPNIGIVAASHGSPTLVGDGDGTMTSVAVFSGVTVTETITATCIAAASNGGLFQVAGSQSGQLGVATVGSAFLSAVIGFTITDGATDYSVGDVWTVTTVGANYV